jgi:ATP-dependent RNA helicase RhlE
MKHGANRLTEYLNDQGITAMAIHGNKSQTARTKALADFKSGELQVLVATDIAARGIDIDQLPHVVNFELPNVPEDYVHRIGRTGRAGASGEAISLACVDEEIFLRDIEGLIKRSIPREVVPGFEPDPSERAEPIVLGRMTIGVGGTKRSGGGGGRRGEAPRRDAPRQGAGAATSRPQGSAQARPAQRPHAERSPDRNATRGAATSHGRPSGGGRGNASGGRGSGAAPVGSVSSFAGGPRGSQGPRNRGSR